VNGLRAVEGDSQSREIEGGAFGDGDAAGAEFVGEIGTAGGGDTEAREELEPAERFLQEGRGRHQQASGADVERLHRETDEPHVVEEREPARDDIGGVVAIEPPDHLLVGEELSVREHDAFRLAGGAGGVLQKRERGGAENGGARPLVGEGGGIGEIVGREKREGGVTEIFGGDVGGDGEEGAGGERDVRAGIGDDGAEAADGLVGARRIRGHGDDAGVETAEKGGEKIEPGRKEEQRAVAGGTPRAQGDGDRASLSIEFPVTEGAGDFFAGRQETKSRASFERGCADAQEIGPCFAGN
jgi:hypothetical protein